MKMFSKSDATSVNVRIVPGNGEIRLADMAYMNQINAENITIAERN